MPSRTRHRIRWIVLLTCVVVHVARTERAPVEENRSDKSVRVMERAKNVKDDILTTNYATLPDIYTTNTPLVSSSFILNPTNINNNRPFSKPNNNTHSNNEIDKNKVTSMKRNTPQLFFKKRRTQRKMNKNNTSVNDHRGKYKIESSENKNKRETRSVTEIHSFGFHSGREGVRYVDSDMSINNGCNYKLLKNPDSNTRCTGISKNSDGANNYEPITPNSQDLSTIRTDFNNFEVQNSSDSFQTKYVSENLYRGQLERYPKNDKSDFHRNDSEFEKSGKDTELPENNQMNIKETTHSTGSRRLGRNNNATYRDPWTDYINSQHKSNPSTAQNTRTEDRESDSPYVGTMGNGHNYENQQHNEYGILGDDFNSRRPYYSGRSEVTQNYRQPVYYRTDISTESNDYVNYYADSSEIPQNERNSLKNVDVATARSEVDTHYYAGFDEASRRPQQLESPLSSASDKEYGNMQHYSNFGATSHHSHHKPSALTSGRIYNNGHYHKVGNEDSPNSHTLERPISTASGNSYEGARHQITVLNNERNKQQPVHSTATASGTRFNKGSHLMEYYKTSTDPTATAFARRYGSWRDARIGEVLVTDHKPTTSKPVAEPRVGSGGDTVASYYDFLINEGSYKFWAVFQVVTALLLIYSAFAAIYYAKYTFSMMDYPDYLDDGFFFKRSGDVYVTTTTTTTPKPSSFSFLGLSPQTFQRIMNALSSKKYS